MAFKLNRSSKEPMSEINVTPFVDVMLVLLIIFMVTAPLLTVGVQVDLPESSADSLPEEVEPLTLSINSKGEIFIQETKVEYEKIIAKINHISLYIVVFVITISGALKKLFNGEILDLFFFNLEIKENFDLADFFYDIHIFANYFLLALISLHIFAVLVHKVLFKENLLKKIL